MPLLLRSEEMILLAVWKLQPDAYGVTIRRYLIEVTGQSWSMASVYVPLDRLADRGLVEALHGAPTKERGGRRRRFFRLTRRGVAALSELHAVQEVLWDGFVDWTRSA
jgi:DNA-binding PadR family transcriptional regulator